MFCLCDYCDLECYQHEHRECNRCGCFDECMERHPDENKDDENVPYGCCGDCLQKGELL